jgi:hypothetical protein
MVQKIKQSNIFGKTQECLSSLFKKADALKTEIPVAKCKSWNNKENGISIWETGVNALKNAKEARRLEYLAKGRARKAALKAKMEKFPGFIEYYKECLKLRPLRV